MSLWKTAINLCYFTDWNYGRQENGRQEKQVACCDSLLLSTTSPDSLALTEQDEKFGVYRLQYVDRSPKGQGRATFKHIDRQLFLYYVTEPQVSGWIVGPRPGVSLGGLFVRVCNNVGCWRARVFARAQKINDQLNELIFRVPPSVWSTWHLPRGSTTIETSSYEMKALAFHAFPKVTWMVSLSYHSSLRLLLGCITTAI